MGGGASSQDAAEEQPHEQVQEDDPTHQLTAGAMHPRKAAPKKSAAAEAVTREPVKMPVRVHHQHSHTSRSAVAAAPQCAV